ncbi:hypothetical protein B0H66DRAFT_535724 [Apodospora peruviana]|uniref:Rhodopsin domain-containing protein n=1 Tax=Apodospora peruviana TaxID=516989 RepID=A0AAE0M0L9_9PEZI|nr:hypothetical protein B0H66DRAFT_535724 [Apodospora peruviana]
MALSSWILQARQDSSSSSVDPAHDPSLPHNDLGPQLNTVFWLLTGVSLAFMLTRIFCKVIRGRHLWWDDYILMAAWVALAVSAATTTVCVALDYGKHGYDMRPENLPKMPFVAVFAGFFSVLAAAWSKTSFALTLLRLANSPAMKLAIWFIIITVNAVLGTAMLFMWIKCKPFARVWDESIDGSCIDPAKIIKFYQFTAGYSGAMDIILAMFPWFIIWELTMTKREKAGVAIAMSMGVIAGATSLVKMVKLPQLAGDPTDTVAVTIWGAAEGAITIIAASIPVLRMLIRHGIDKYHSPARFNTTDNHYLQHGAQGSSSAASPITISSPFRNMTPPEKPLPWLPMQSPQKSAASHHDSWPIVEYPVTSNEAKWEWERRMRSLSGHVIEVDFPSRSEGSRPRNDVV